MNRSTSVRVCASPSALCCKTEYASVQADWSEPTNLDGWGKCEISTGLVWVNMHVCLDSRSVGSRSKGEGVAGKGKMLAAGWFHLVWYQLSWQEGSELAEEGDPAQRKTPPGRLFSANATQNQTCTHFPSNRRVVQVNQITCNLISFLLGFKMCSKVKLYCKKAFFF